jgi:hypothetical protein
VKVVYRKTILEWIAQERVRALNDGKEIEKIVLTVAETRRLLDEVDAPYMTATSLGLRNWLAGIERWGRTSDEPPQPRLLVMGIDIQVSR